MYTGTFNFSCLIFQGGIRTEDLEDLALTAFVTIALQQTLQAYKSPDVVGSLTDCLTLSLKAIPQRRVHPIILSTANEEAKVC